LKQPLRDIYSDLFVNVIAVDALVAYEAVQLRSATVQRLPTIDGLIAATAVVHQSILVHRDPHLSAIQEQGFRQVLLPAR